MQTVRVFETRELGRERPLIEQSLGTDKYHLRGQVARTYKEQS